MENIPIVYPQYELVFQEMFVELQRLYSNGGEKGTKTKKIERLANAIVYELYLLDDDRLQKKVSSALREKIECQREVKVDTFLKFSKHERVDEIFSMDIVKRIESSPRMNN